MGAIVKFEVRRKLLGEDVDVEKMFGGSLSVEVLIDEELIVEAVIVELMIPLMLRNMEPFIFQMSPSQCRLQSSTPVKRVLISHHWRCATKDGWCHSQRSVDRKQAPEGN
jgi:hypothetical protein